MAVFSRPPIPGSPLSLEPCLSCDARAESVCNAIADADLARLAAFAVVTEVPPGQTFIEEGEPADSFFNITAGTAKLFKLLPDGRRQITGFAGRRAFPRPCRLRHLRVQRRGDRAGALLPLPPRRLRSLLDDFPAMEKRLLEVAANELVAAQEQMLLLGRKTARERLASFLVMQSRQGRACGRSGADGSRCR